MNGCRKEEINISPARYGASLAAQMVKSLSAVQEIQVLALGQEDPLEKGKATHSSFLVWKIPWTEELVGL